MSSVSVTWKQFVHNVKPGDIAFFTPDFSIPASKDAVCFITEICEQNVCKIKFTSSVKTIWVTRILVSDSIFTIEGHIQFKQLD